MTTAVNRSVSDRCSCGTRRRRRRVQCGRKKRSCAGSCPGKHRGAEPARPGTMSGEKTSSPCNKFQANVFNKSKCQNCFKSRELHLLRDRDQEQAKPVYGGWLCLAPEGTDFDNPMQRSRKWQRRFFILYERGSLSFALDELPSTLPQGTVNLNLCTDIGDAEPRTGQRNALCIATSQQEIFIRGDNKEIINGWSEQLAAYLRTNKQVQKKKRKVEPVATAQEPSPAKMAATDPAESGRGRWQEEEQRGGGPDVTEQSPAGNSSAPDGADGFGKPPLDAAPSRDIHQPANDENENQDGSRRSAAERILGSEQGPVSIRGRTEARSSRREKLQSCSDSAQLGAPAPQRRARSLDRRTSDTVMTVSVRLEALSLALLTSTMSLVVFLRAHLHLQPCT
uniref:PH domain-containing protein n=1 Tax=Scophthalmus maximus TaxID=52904 RepID=A0A8D3AS14_SCOMX